MSTCSTQAPSSYVRGSTPSLSKASHTPSAQFGYTEALRNAAVLDAEGSVFEVDLEWYCDTLLPRLDPSTQSTALTNLRSRNPPAINNDGRLRGFPTDPCRSDYNEDRTFRPLVTAINAVLNAVATDKGLPHLHYSSNPNMVPDFVERKTLSRPDGSLRLIGEDLAWIRMACLAELKKEDSEDTAQDNAKKIIWSLQQTLRDDARRRFCFAFSIEDTQMRLWFASRGVCVVTHSFNFITDHAFFIRFFLSLAYADEHELGWDPTMVRLEGGQFDITVQSQNGTRSTYRTEELKSNYMADCLLSRGSRVWTARHLSRGQPTGELVAIKDTWIDSDRVREGDIPKAINSALRGKDRSSMKWMFLTVLRHGDVCIDTRDAHGTTSYVDHGWSTHGDRNIPEDASLFVLQGPPSLKKDATPAEGYPFSRKDHITVNKVIRRGMKVHYRIVFKEVCEPIYKLESLGLIFTALVHACLALTLLHRAGYTHRDISIGNILTDEYGSARLGDLEYTISTSSTVPLHPVRTAMAHFMALEVEMNTYHYINSTTTRTSGPFPLPTCHELVEEIRNSRDKNLRRSPRLSKKRRPKSFTPPPQDSPEQSPTRRFQYNPLHDLESLWWVAVYFIFKREPASFDEGDDADGLREAARKMFTRRWYAFFGHDFLGHCRFLPKALKPIGIRLNILRIELCRCYVDFDKDPSSTNYKVFKSLHDYMGNTFKYISYLCKEENIKMRPWDQDDDADFFATVSRERDTASDQAAQDNNPQSARTPQITNNEASVASRTLTRMSRAVHFIGKRPRSTSESTDDEDDAAPPAKKVKTSGKTTLAYVGRRPATRHLRIRR